MAAAAYKAKRFAFVSAWLLLWLYAITPPVPLLYALAQKSAEQTAPRFLFF
jgi:hypothetical protein